jgi:hypothetical protein
MGTELKFSTAFYSQTNSQSEQTKAQSRQKSYADNQMRPLEFEMGDRVFLKVSLMRGVIRFRKKGKLSLKFVGPFEIT